VYLLVDLVFSIIINESIELLIITRWKQWGLWRS